MLKQNRALGFLLLFAFFVVGMILFRNGDFLGAAKPSPLVTDVKLTPSTTEETMGDPVSDETKPGVRPNLPPNPADAVANALEKKNFVEAMRAMATCLQMKTALPAAVSADPDSFLAILQSEWGAPNLTDHWMAWHFRNHEGVEHRLRLDVVEGGGGSGRELHYFTVDREGLPIPLELENVQTHNPSDEVINGILKEGDVFHKEKSVGGVFPGGETVEYTEKNDALDAVEVHHANKTFHCLTAPAAKTCVCQ
jgi:hypothetical protein